MNETGVLRGQLPTDHSKFSFKIHTNAIVAILWSKDDTFDATKFHSTIFDSTSICHSPPLWKFEWSFLLSQ